MRRLAISLSGLVALAVAFLTTAPAAFAMRLAPPDGGGAPVTASRVVHHHGGLGFWQVSVDRSCRHRDVERSGRGRGDQGVAALGASGRDQLILIRGWTAGRRTRRRLPVVRPTGPATRRQYRQLCLYAAG